MTETEHLLTCLMEEAAEIQKACAKALRFGLDDTWSDLTQLPQWLLTPRQEIIHELNDLSGITILLIQRHIITDISDVDVNAAQLKAAKVLSLMKYARKQGTLQDG